MNKNLQMLRGIACIYVCLQHFSWFSNLGWGAIGVEVFFVLSGYLTMEHLKRGKLEKEYLIKKMVKILPLYYLGTAVVFLAGVIFPQFFSNLTFNVRNLFFSVMLIPGQTSFYIYPGWTLTYMFYFYFLVWVLNWCTKESGKKTGFFASMLIVILTIISQMISKSGIIIDLFKAYNSPVMLEFVFGLLASFVGGDLLKSINNKVCKVMFVISIISVFFFNWDFMEHRYLMPALVIVFVMVFCIQSRFNESNVVYSILVKIGNSSFTIYILHTLFIRPLDKMMLLLKLNYIQYILGVFIGVCITVGVLVILDNVFVKKVTNLLLKMIYSDKKVKKLHN